MPGIHFVHGRQTHNGPSSFEETLGELLHDEQYRAEVLFSDETVSLGATRYPEYPTTVWDDADYFIVLEGKLYGLNDKQLHADLRSLSSLLFQDAFDAVICLCEACGLIGRGDDAMEHPLAILRNISHRSIGNLFDYGEEETC